MPMRERVRRSMRVVGEVVRMVGWPEKVAPRGEEAEVEDACIVEIWCVRRARVLVVCTVA